jgi:hypothetical protein
VHAAAPAAEAWLLRLRSLLLLRLLLFLRLLLLLRLLLRLACKEKGLTLGQWHSHSLAANA